MRHVEEALQTPDQLEMRDVPDVMKLHDQLIDPRQHVVGRLA